MLLQITLMKQCLTIVSRNKLLFSQSQNNIILSGNDQFTNYIFKKQQITNFIVKKQKLLSVLSRNNKLVTIILGKRILFSGDNKLMYYHEHSKLIY